MGFERRLQDDFQHARLKLVAPGRFGRLPRVAGGLDFAIVESEAGFGGAFVAGDDLRRQIDGGSKYFRDVVAAGAGADTAELYHLL